MRKIFQLASALLVIALLFVTFGCAKPAPATTTAPKPAPATTTAPKPAPATTTAPKPAPATTTAPKPAPATTTAPKPAPAQVIELKFADASAPTGWWVTNCKDAYIQALEKATGGRLHFTVYAGGVLLKGGDLYDGLAKGAVDMAPIFPTDLVGRFPLTDILGLPFAAPSAEVASKIYVDMWPVLEKEYPEVKSFPPYAMGMYYPWTTGKQVRNPTDLKGAKIRTAGTFETDLIKSIGGSPITMPSIEMYTSFQKGLAEACFLGVLSVDLVKLQEVLSYFVDVPIYNKPYILGMMNLQTWNKLPPDIQRIITDVNKEWMIKIGGMYDGWTKDFLKTKAAEWKVKVYTPTPDEVKAWKALGKPLWDKWLAEVEAKGKPGRDVLNEYNKILKKYGIAVE